MNGPRQVLVLLKYRLLSLGRLLRAHAFPVFVLGPMILGGALWVADRYLYLVRGPLAALVASDSASSGAAPGALGLLAALAAAGLALPSLEREIYPTRSAGGYLDALPLPETARFHVALAAGWIHQLPAVVVFLAALSALDDWDAGLLTLARWALALFVSFLPLTLAGMIAVFVRVRLGTLQRGGGLLLFGLAAVLAGLVALAPVHRLFGLLPLWAPAFELEAALAQALGVDGVGEGGGFVGVAASVAVLYPLALVLDLRYRRRDLERAEALVWRSRPGSVGRRLSLTGARPTALRAQLLRDLLLVGRRFSPAVYLAAGLALVAEAVVFLVVPTLGFGSLWTLRFTLVGSVVAVLALVALVPLLLKHQLPRFWLEKSTAVRQSEVWRTKLWLSRLLAAPAVVLSGVLLAALSDPDDPAQLAVALLQLGAASWIVASMTGLAAFEIAPQPILGLVFSSLLGLALAALFIFYPQVFWMWGGFYLYVASKLAERADRQVRLTEVES